MKLRFYYYTNTGKVRTNNEDAILVVDKIISEESFNECKEEIVKEDNFIFAVADGMGGHSKGEVASRLVLETINDHNGKMFENTEEILQLSKKRLDQYAKENPDALNLGSAIAGIIIKNYTAKIFNIGDCRVYRFINNKLIRLSKDHSVVERLLSLGLIDESQVKIHPERHIITSAIIGDLSEKIEEIYITETEIFGEDTFIVCSDGFWEELESQEIINALKQENPCKSLLQTLDQKPLKDNVSFILINIENYT